MCAPTVVAGTKAQELFPPMSQAMPKQLAFWSSASREELTQALRPFSSFVFAPCCDAASGNVFMLKFLGARLEEATASMGFKLLFLPDLCQAHQHQRGKLAIKRLSFHTSRHFSLAKLLRNEKVLEQVTKAVGAQVRSRVQRVTAEPPAEASRLKAALNFLWRLDDLGENLADKQAQRFVAALQVVANLVNDDTTTAQWRHYCVPRDGRPCCRNERESKTKVADAILAACFGRAEEIPGEGKWTYMMKAFKRTVLRKILHNSGVLKTAMFPPRREAAATPVQGDDDEEPSQVALRSLRLARSCDYLNQESNFWELGVQVIVMRMATTCSTICSEALTGRGRLAKLPSCCRSMARRSPFACSP